MSPTDASLRDLNDCGCCSGIDRETPFGIDNRPGLSAIAYRAGTHQQFKETMLARLSSPDHPALRNLRTRDDSDFSIGLLDGFATVADVLTFYQERIANENYLRTATERLSILELGRLIGYELRPGVAASVLLAFTLEDVPGAFGQGLGLTPLGLAGQKVPSPPPAVALNTGTKVQSVPGPGETAQIFETVESIEAHPGWNGIFPRLTWPQPLATDADFLILSGAANNVKAGDFLLLLGGTLQAVRKVVSITVDSNANTTRVDFTAKPASPPAFALPGLTDGAASDFAPGTPINDATVKTIVQKRWDQDVLAAIAKSQNWSLDELELNIERQSMPAASPGVFVLRTRAAVFGHNAPFWDSLPASLRYGEKYTGGSPSPIPIPAAFPTSWEGRTLEQDSQADSETRSIFLDNTYPQIVPGSWIVLINSSGDKAFLQVLSCDDTSRTDYLISAKISRVKVALKTAIDAKFTIRNTTVLCVSEPLALADLPIVDAVGSDPVTLDGPYLGLKSGKTVIVTGQREDLQGVPASENRTIKTASLEAGFTVLEFDKPLTLTYTRATVRINANVALATHGETRSEVLGAGDASQVFQKFTLKQPPLTYVSAVNPTGAASTLELRVDDLLWTEVPELFGHGPGERIYITRQEDGGSTTVIFGDGRTGARLPTGIENVRAVYRSGIGVAGLVKADQLTQLANKPLGLKGVTNPMPATGAQDPEVLEDARINAPLQVLTMGRIVSLEDYEDFARAYSGIGKALATSTWNGQVRGIFVTVAGAKGAQVPPSDTLYQNLVKSMRAAGDSTVPLTVVSYAPVGFKVSALVKVDPAYIPAKVLAQVEAALRTAFSFDAREFGQPVALSEVIAVMQGVAGVIAVDVTALYRAGEPAVRNALLPASLPRTGSTTANASPAELLTIDPAPLNLGVMA